MDSFYACITALDVALAIGILAGQALNSVLNPQLMVNIADISFILIGLWLIICG